MCHLRLFALLGFLTLASTACRDGKIAVYRIPKETEAPVVDPATAPASTDAPLAKTPGGLAVANIAAPGLEWTAPAGWKTKVASAMRKASYTVGEDGVTGGDLAITAFPGNVGGDLANVNRWRGQLQLPPIEESEIANASSRLEANGLKFLIVDFTGGPADKPQRMLGAMVPYEGATWFFKLTGPDALVVSAKPAYLGFLRTVKPSARANTPVVDPAPALSPPDMANSSVPVVSGLDLKWTAPSHWQGKAPSAMRKATYLIPGEGGTTADLSVTAFPGAVGGELANINRWRSQLQLAPLSEADLPAGVTRITVNGLPVALVDLTGGPTDKPQRMLGAIVPSNGANWFFKLTGPEALVAKEKPAFLAFVQSLHSR